MILLHPFLARHSKGFNKIMDMPLGIHQFPEDKKPYDLFNQKNPQLIGGFRGVFG